MKHIVSIEDLQEETISVVLARAKDLKESGFEATLDKKIISILFFEPSTRTRISFETAVFRSGGHVVGVTDTRTTSSSKGESLEDTIRIISSYADAIVMRHPDAGSAARAAAVSSVPVINAGDGPNAHPTQTLLDLFSVQEVLGRLEDFTITMVGDMKYSRVAHSLSQVLMRYKNVKQIWVNPDELPMPENLREMAKTNNIQMVEQSEYQSVLGETDILLMTRVQQERFTDKAQYEALKDMYILTKEDLSQAKEGMKIISPLPRTYELPEEIDSTPQAYYFQQAANGVPVRAALLEYLLTQ